MNIGEMIQGVAALPEIGDSAVYQVADRQARKVRVTVAEIFANGRIKVEFPDGSWKSLPRHYHKRVQNQRYGLVRIARAKMPLSQIPPGP